MFKISHSRDINLLEPKNITGFILNTPTDYKWGVLRLPFKRKHWIAIKRLGSAYYNLDSKLDAPELIGKEDDLMDFLRDQIEGGDKELLLVVTNDIDQSGAWRKSCQPKDSVGGESQKSNGSELCSVQCADDL